MRTKLFGLLCLLMVLVMNSACSSGGKMKDVLEQVPANTDMVVVGNLKTIVESAGGEIKDSKIKLPTYCLSLPDSKELGEGVDKANDFLVKSGIDEEACALMFDFRLNRPVYVFLLEDQDKFVATVKGEGYTEGKSEGDVKCFSKKVYESSWDSEYDDYAYLVVNGSCAYWIEEYCPKGNADAIAYLKRCVADSKESNFADTAYGKYIVEDNAAGLAFSLPDEAKRELLKEGLPSEMLDLCNGYFCMKGNLDKNDCTVTCKLLDEDGKEVSADRWAKYMDVSATINEKALAFMGKDEFLICAMSLKNFNWDNYADLLAAASGMSRSDKAQMNVVMSYLKNIDGTVAYGWGLKNGLESVEKMANKEDLLNQFSTTLVIETKDGKAQRLLDDLKGFLEKERMPFPVQETSDGMVITLDQNGASGKVCVKCVGNFLVVANHDITDNNDNELVKGTNFDEHLTAFCIGLSKDNKLMRDLGIQNDVKLGMYAKPKSTEVFAKFEISGDGDDGVIARAAKTIVKLFGKSEELNQRFNRNRTAEAMEADVDSVVVDTVADDYYDDYCEADSAACA